jgi:twitching motility protein PilJ
MAITFGNFKGLSGRRTQRDGVLSDQTTLIMTNLRKLADREVGQLPVIGKLPVEKQYLYAAGGLLVSLLLAAGFTVYSSVESGNKVQYEEKSGRITMLTQRLPLVAQQATLGNPIAFKALAASKADFERTLAGLREGDADVPASPRSVQATLEKLQRDWQPLGIGAAGILSQEKSLVELARNVKLIDESSGRLREVSQQLSDLLFQSGAGVRQQTLANRQEILAISISKGVNGLLASDTIDPQLILQLEKDVKTFGDSMQYLLRGNSNLGIAPIQDESAKLTVIDMQGVFQTMERAVTAVLGSSRPLVQSKQAAHELFVASESLLEDSASLSRAYSGLGTLGYGIAALFAVTALASLILLGLVNINDTRSRARKSEDENRRNQEAILRLMDELGELAQGNLTIEASVTEYITGAVADSINYTVEELRSLVRGINHATGQLETATGRAFQVSEKLTTATHKQVQEIEDTSQAVVDISQSVQRVSASALESAKVARQSLAAAEKGQAAVHNTISGMNQLREQIQETAKRIKRLGESSQEIGEIVEMISDITEQTNVLALNAAIQAASAGEAGRGFTVVAEEVQRLAERSGDATKQIAALVRTIQSDTQDTVAAMEVSTQSVVEGARLSDAAGQTLNEISQVSQKLAQLIQEISSATQSQAERTSQVAETMQDIKRISMDTSEGTQITAKSVSDLAKLADELKKSVAGFKLA